MEETRLLALVRRAVPGATALAGVERLSGGANNETWALDAVTPSGRVPLILSRKAAFRRDRAADLSQLRSRSRHPDPRLMDFDLPADLVADLAELDAFIAAEIAPLEAADDNVRFFDHRLRDFGTPEQRDGVAGWRIDGEEMRTTGMHTASHCLTFARTSGGAGQARGITAFAVPTGTPGLKVEEYPWTFDMPTDPPRVSFTGESAACANARKPFGKALSTNQGIPFPLVELATQTEMLRLLIRNTAWEMDRMPKPEVEKRPSEHIDRHHRRYRITEGSEEIQMRKVAGHLFGFMGAGAA